MHSQLSFPAQTSSVTCGVTALAVVASRTRFPGYAAVPGESVAEEQARLHGIASRTGVPWPRLLGTAPWALSKLAGEVTGDRYQTLLWTSSRTKKSRQHQVSIRHRRRPSAVRSQRDGQPSNHAMDALLAAIQADKDSFLYVGGSTRNRSQRWIPRHVVAVLGAESDAAVLSIFEPSSGRVFRVPTDSLIESSASPRSEFGNWSYPQLAIVPIVD